MYFIGRLICTVLLVFGSMAIAMGAAEPKPDKETQKLSRQVVKAATALVKGNLAVSDKQFDLIVADPSFAKLTAREQHVSLISSAELALHNGDKKKARERAIAANKTAVVSGSGWRIRATAAEARDWPEMLLSLSALANGFPEELSVLSSASILTIIRESEKSPAVSDARWELLLALNRTGWNSDSPEAQVLWKDLTLHLLENDRAAHADEAVRGINDLAILVGMRADNRFAEVVKANAYRFDMSDVAELDIESRRAIVQQRPRSLKALTQLNEALFRAKRYDEVLQLTTEAIAQTLQKTGSPYQDQAEQLPWIINNKGRALRRLNRLDEAVEYYEQAAKLTPNLVGHQINLAAILARVGRTSDALAALSRTTGSVSPFGKMQMESVRLIVALETGDSASIENSLAYLAAHRLDDEATYQSGLLRADRMDQAAQVLIQRLATPATRFDALVELHRVYDPIPTPSGNKLRERWLAIQQRLDVRAAIDSVAILSPHELDLD
ncbi:MAG TPA: tetratricopeptide repeat protein [Steroidobacteraceae bacterium]|nr:tetratricopeptide repeat protein [Steroidobacteraceae bacterium]